MGIPDGIKVFWAKHGPAIFHLIEGVDAATDLGLFMQNIGLMRKSHRDPSKAVLNEEWMPRLALKEWHKKRNAEVRGKLTAHENIIIDSLMMSLHEEQQNSLIVKMANYSFEKDPTRNDIGLKRGAKMYKDLAALPNNDTRIVRLDGLDWIKDPANEYLTVKGMELSAEAWKKVQEIATYIRNNPASTLATKVGIPVDAINDKLGSPAATAAGTAKPGNLHDHSVNLLDRMRARRDAAKN